MRPTSFANGAKKAEHGADEWLETKAEQAEAARVAPGRDASAANRELVRRAGSAPWVKATQDSVSAANSGKPRTPPPPRV